MAAAAALSLSLAACFTVKEEVQRTPSPDGELEAVVVRVNGHATVSYAYDVYVEVAGARPRTKVADFYGVYPANGWNDGVMPIWTADDALELRFGSARQGNVDIEFASVAGRRVSVRCMGNVELPDEDNKCMPPSPNGAVDVQN